LRAAAAAATPYAQTLASAHRMDGAHSADRDADRDTDRDANHDADVARSARRGERTTTITDALRNGGSDVRARRALRSASAACIAALHAKASRKKMI
jgi:hypothetical protein